MLKYSNETLIDDFKKSFMYLSPEEFTVYLEKNLFSLPNLQDFLNITNECKIYGLEEFKAREKKQKILLTFIEKLSFESNKSLHNQAKLN